MASETLDVPMKAEEGTYDCVCIVYDDREILIQRAHRKPWSCHLEDCAHVCMINLTVSERRINLQMTHVASLFAGLYFNVDIHILRVSLCRINSIKKRAVCGMFFPTTYLMT